MKYTISIAFVPIMATCISRSDTDAAIAGPRFRATAQNRVLYDQSNGSIEADSTNSTMYDMVVIPASANKFSIAQFARDDTANCWCGTMTCIDGSKVCINPLKYVGCTFNALLNLDKVAATMADIFVDFVQDPAGFVIDVGVAEVTSIFQDVKSCYM